MTKTQAPRPVVMVVDDDEGVHAALRLVLDDEFEVISAFSGEAGIRQLARRDVAIVLLDLVMPGVDG
ncbi:MAG TPA: response regulator [Methylomirabilota bacterium]